MFEQIYLIKVAVEEKCSEIEDRYPQTGAFPVNRNALQ